MKTGVSPVVAPACLAAAEKIPGAGILGDLLGALQGLRLGLLAAHRRHHTVANVGEGRQRRGQGLDVLHDHPARRGLHGHGHAAGGQVEGGLLHRVGERRRVAGCSGCETVVSRGFRPGSLASAMKSLADCSAARGLLGLGLRRALGGLGGQSRPDLGGHRLLGLPASLP